MALINVVENEVPFNCLSAAERWVRLSCYPRILADEKVLSTYHLSLRGSSHQGFLETGPLTPPLMLHHCHKFRMHLRKEGVSA